MKRSGCYLHWARQLCIKWLVHQLSPGCAFERRGLESQSPESEFADGRRGSGGKLWLELSFLTACWMKLSLRLLVLHLRLHVCNLPPDDSRLKNL